MNSNPFKKKPVEHKPLIAQRHYVSGDHSFEVVSAHSETVPDESYPIAEILKKFSSLPNLMREAVYYDGGHDSLDVEKLKHIDPIDRDIIKSAVDADIKKYQAELDAQNAKAAAEAAEAKSDAEYLRDQRKQKSKPGTEGAGDASQKRAHSDEGAQGKLL